MELRDYMHVYRVSGRALAKKVGTSAAYISTIVTGARKPGKEVAMKIQLATQGQVSAAELMGLTTPDIDMSGASYYA